MFYNFNYFHIVVLFFIYNFRPNLCNKISIQNINEYEKEISMYNEFVKQRFEPNFLKDKPSSSSLYNPKNSMIRSSRSVFHVKQNPLEKYIVEGKEKPAVNKTKLSPRPSFNLSKNIPLTMDPKVYRCNIPESIECKNRTNLYRNRIYTELKKSMQFYLNESNYYNVDTKAKSLFFDLRYFPSTCLAKRANVRILKRKDHPFNKVYLGKLFPKKKLFKHIKNIQNCAIISSAGSMAGSKLGKFIDHHDIVMRFNNAPVEGYEVDVGSKTTIRVVNSQVVTKPQFNFTESPIFHNTIIAAWDPGKYNSTLKDWLNNAADFDLFSNYEKYRKKYPKYDAYLIDPRSIWHLWQMLHIFSGEPIRKNPPSSGFIGLSLLLPHCPYIDFIEYIPSTRLNGRCHYYSKELNAACTFGAWHPLAAEKLMTLDMNIADDFTVFQEGIIRIRRPDHLLCDSISNLLRF
ncbi:beta-galactoside alpha-2,6-sialyltransferase 1 [Condylostylus longicornis]|uniref:beta-galactoside alpha-2,6-sialyltransferase 1 n=1 Tax=Condylostylus longicornis TaxID=2530218 RepID=UPI00244DD9D6|nr:beta-galactoside alpha-2,6-sialyltransferase 1 [Condylostylus longicornis]